jgi:sugar diacid utilization regulator
MTADKVLSDANDLVQAMIFALHEGRGLPALSGILADFIRAGVGILDIGGALLCDAYYDQCPLEQKRLLREHIAGQQSPAHQAIYHLSLPLAYSGRNAGTLIVARPDEPLTETEQLAVMQSAGLFCIQLAQDEKIAEIELRLKGNFVEDLISARYSDPESIISRARALNYNITAPHRVLVATVENMQQLLSREPAAATLKTDIVQMLQSRINQSARGMAIAGKEEFILLIQQKKAVNDITDIKQLAETLVSDAEASFKAKMYIGIGSVCSELPDFSASYLAAKKALEIGEYMITEGQVRSFEQFKVHALFLSTLKPAALYNYAREQLDALLQYDQKHGTDFLKTLQEFLYQRNNVERTAKSIKMSVSGLKYRLQKIEKILGHDLRDNKVCFDLQLALVILQLFGEYRA